MASTLRSMVATWAAVAVAAVIMFPFWPALILALWTGTAAQHGMRPFRRLTGGRHRAAATLTVLTVLLLVAPLVAVAWILTSDAALLIDRMIASHEMQSFLRGLVASDSGTHSLTDLVTSHGDRAWQLVSSVSGIAVEVILNVMVFVITIYAVLADGPSLYAWCERHGPLEPIVLARFRSAFNETGRGLFYGVLMAGLAQGAAAAVIFVGLGVPRAVVLGFLTVVASVVPNLGSALVWGPVAAGLAIAGRSTEAIILVGLGIVFIGGIDNVLVPLLSRRAQLQLPAFLVLIAILGGILIFGTWGFLAGPLLLRLAKEALLIVSDDRATTAARPQTEAPDPAAPRS